MRFFRRYVAVQLSVPLLFALPFALSFLRAVLSLSGSRWMRVVALGAGGYLAGAVVFAFGVARLARDVEHAVASHRDSSDAVTRCLSGTVYAAALLWLAWGFAQAVVGWAALSRSFLGFQYFVEAALIIATPAMAWCYWTGKQLLVTYAGETLGSGYTGRAWSFRAKIGMVFVGFFAVSVGAIVLVVSSQIARTLGAEAAYSVGRFSLAVAVGTMALFGAATYFLARDITVPMHALVKLAQEMAEGHFDVEPHIFADDEVGTLARSVGTTRETLRVLIGGVRSSGNVIAQGVVTMTGGTKLLISGAHEQSGLTEASSGALQQVRDEAKSVLADVERVTDRTSDSASRAAELRASFREVNRRSDELFESVSQSSAAATQIESAAREMASRTMTLSSAGSDVLAFVAQMDSTVAQITRNAAETAQLSEEVRQNAGEGRGAVDATVNGIRKAQESTRRTTDAFDALQKSLGQIDQILEFIDEVTNKTNLLSLNAAIIAAHAGARDFGFSVIADEVRQLADRTRTATKEISGIIRSVQPVTQEAMSALDEGVRTVDATVGLATSASHALATILTSADRSLEMNYAMSSSLQEQAQASQHLHRIMAQMTDHISEIHRATAGQAEATRLLAAEAERVQDIAQQVKRATDEQTAVEDGIARAMESIADDVRMIRDRLDSQLQHTQDIATNSTQMLTIARRNNGIAEDFGVALRDLLQQGEKFRLEVARFRA